MCSVIVLNVSPLPQSRSRHLKQIFFSINPNRPINSNIYFIIAVFIKQINRFFKYFRNKHEKSLKISLDNRKSLCYNLSCSCGCSSSGRAPPCQGGGSEFEPRHPLHKPRFVIDRPRFFLFYNLVFLLQIIFLYDIIYIYPL